MPTSVRPPSSARPRRISGGVGSHCPCLHVAALIATGATASSIILPTRASAAGETADRNKPAAAGQSASTSPASAGASGSSPSGTSVASASTEAEIPLPKAGSTRPVQFSNLSDGTFDKQFDSPPSEALAPGSALMLKAAATYAKLPFDIGERMRFVVTYLGVKGGTAEVFLRSPVKAPGSAEGWAHRITGEVKSAEWYRWITRVHDAVEGLMDASPELVPLRFYINQQEGDFRQTRLVEFFAGEGKIRQRTKRKDRDLKRAEFPFGTDTKDALGALYYFRGKVPPDAGVKAFDFPVFTSEKTWTLKARLEKRETLSIDGRKFDTDVWQITSHFGGLMEQKGDIRLWLTRDTRRLPVYAEANVKFGALKLHLAEWDQGWADGKAKTLYDKIRLEP